MLARRSRPRPAAASMCGDASMGTGGCRHRVSAGSHLTRETSRRAPQPLRGRRSELTLTLAPRVRLGCSRVRLASLAVAFPILRVGRLQLGNIGLPRLVFWPPGAKRELHRQVVGHRFSTHHDSFELYSFFRSIEKGKIDLAHRSRSSTPGRRDNARRAGTGEQGRWRGPW
jgi:hypothetical protein